MKITVNNKQVKNPIAQALILLVTIPFVLAVLAFVFFIILPFVFVVIIPVALLVCGVALVAMFLFPNKKK